MRNVSVITNHRRDLHTTETTGNERLSIGQIIFVLFWDKSCLIRNLKHRCALRSVLSTASSTSYATTTSFRSISNDISHDDNNREVFFSDNIILANIFCRTRGLDLCGLTIEPSNYCGRTGRSSLLQDRKLERPPTKFNIYGMIDTSRKVNSPIFGIPSKI